MSMRNMAYTKIFQPTRCYLVVTELTDDGPSEVDRYVISDDATFGDVCFKLDNRGICKFTLVENYKLVDSRDMGNYTIIQYLHGKGLRILNNAEDEHKFYFGDRINCVFTDASNLNSKKHYTLSLLFVMSGDSDIYSLDKKKLELVLPSSDIQPGAFPRGQLTRTFTSYVHNLLTGDKTLKLSVCLPNAKAEGQKTIKFILYIREETNVKIKYIKIELVENIIKKDRIKNYVDHRKSLSTYKLLYLKKNVYKYEMTFSVPNSLDEDNCDDDGYGMENDTIYIIREYSFIMAVHLPFPHENIRYKIPLQMTCDPMK